MRSLPLLALVLVVALLSGAPRASAVTSAAVPAARLAAQPAGTIYVANSSSNGVTEYPPGSNGDVRPANTISEPGTGLKQPEGLALDGAGDLFAANTGNNSVTEYAPDATTTNSTPIATITGTATGLANPVALAVGPTGRLYVANDLSVSITEYSPGANGNVAPVATISLIDLGVDSLTGVAVNGAGDIFVDTTDEVAEFAPGATGNAAPIAAISGSMTGMNGSYGLAMNAAGDIFVVADRGAGTIAEYAAGASGDVAPVATISGSATGLNLPAGLGLDTAGDLFVANPGDDSVTEYARGANGNVAPAATIAGASTFIHAPDDVIVQPPSMPAKLAFVTQPGSGVSGRPLPSQPVVAVEDAAGNVVATDTSPVRLSITAGTGTGGATLACAANPVAAVAGVATFSGCSISKPGAGYTLSATDGSLAAATSGPFTITLPPRPVARVRWNRTSIAPAASLSGGQRVNLTVTALDSRGVRVPTGLVYVSFRPGSGQDDAAATCGGRPVPGYCTANSNGVVTVGYQASHVQPDGGTDRLIAGADPFGTADASIAYTYAATGAPVRFSWSRTPIAAPGRIGRLGVTVMLSALNHAGDPVQSATIYITRSLAPGSSATISGPGCAPAPGHPGTLACVTDRLGQVPVTYKPAGTATYGSDGIGVSATVVAMPGDWDTYSFTAAFTRARWSHVPIQPSATLRADSRPIILNATALGAGGHPAAGAEVYVSFRPGSNPDNATATCGGAPLPRYCLANSSGVVRVQYTVSRPLANGGTDTVTAAVDPFGTGAATDTYTYGASAAPTRFSWTPEPVARPGSVPANHGVMLTLTALDAAGDPVIAGARVYVSTMGPAGTATHDHFAGCGHNPIPVQPATTLCTVGAGGHLQIGFATGPRPTASGSVGIGVAGTPADSAAWDHYDLSAAVSRLAWRQHVVAPAGTLRAGQTVDASVTALGPSGHPVAGAQVYVELAGTSAAVASCDGQALPRYCTADSRGVVTVRYTTPSPLPDGGTDTLRAAIDPFGTVQSTTTYAYTSTGQPAIFAWSPRPFGAPGQLAIGARFTLTLTVDDATGSPVSGGVVYVTSSLAPGSDAKVTGTGCTGVSGHPGVLSCVTDPTGHVRLGYVAPTTTPPGGSDGIGAAAAPAAPSDYASWTWDVHTF